MDMEFNPEQKAVRIAFVHHKGGTGKTTSCINVSGWLAKKNNKVLVVDLDPQGNATAGLGIDRNTIDNSVYDVIFGEKDISEVILETDSGVFLAPSSLDLLAAETHLAGRINNTTILRDSLISVEDYFDYILVDVPPGSTILMINGIVAAEHLVIPIDSGVFGFETLETLKTLVSDLVREVGVSPNIMMILLRDYSVSIFDRGPNKDIRKLLKNFLLENNIPEVKIFNIPFSRKIHGAQMKGIPISHYAPFSNIGRVYKKVAREVIIKTVTSNQ